MKKRILRKGTLVYHQEDGQYHVYVVASEGGGKFSLALPWQPAATVLQNVDAGSLERVFEGRSGR